MSKILKSVAIFISSLNFSYAIANQCPSIDSIRALGLNHIRDGVDWSKVVSYEPYSTYNTNQKWNFHITYSCPIFGKCDEEKILTAAKKSLNTLRFKKGPISGRCEYISHNASIVYIGADLIF